MSTVRCVFFSMRSCCTFPTKTMLRILNVAEKNDAAKSLAEVMSKGRSRRREGFSKFNKIYEYDFFILNSTCTMVMTSVSGHLLNLEFAGLYKKWNSCNPVALFDAQIFKYCPQDYQNIKRTLETEVPRCNALIIWTDCDREGENIGFEIIEVCQKVKPNIQVYRAKFSEITPQAVANACRNLINPDRRVSNAVDVRMELDLRIGAAFTRFQTLRLQKVFPEVLAEQLVSYGSCQFPTLGFVVERYKQVQAFIPEPFWKLKVSHEKTDGTAEFIWERTRLFDHLACLVLYEQCLENPRAVVSEIKSKSKSRWRPQPLDTVELEKLASRKLKINAKETMKIAEKLYTKGYISYPRTETNIFPKDLDLPGLIQQQTQDTSWGDFAAQILEHGPNPRNGNKTDNAHPPIHPTKYASSFEGNDKRIYEFIVRHFLACCSQDALGQETTVTVEIAKEQFTTQGLTITARNYLEVYPYDKWTNKEIPVYTQGETFLPKSIEMSAGETSPPSLLTEADLIALMEKHGIGTDATHAEHIETIKARMYVGIRPDGKFVPGHLGMGLVEGYDAMGYEMSKPHLRAQFELDLKRICDGQKDKNVVLNEQITKYKEVFIQACQQAMKIDEALANYLGEARPYTEEDVGIPDFQPVKPCPVCGLDMILRKTRDGRKYYLGCSGYPNCSHAIWFPDFVLEATIQDSFCSRCQQHRVRMVKFNFRRGSVPPMMGNEYIGCLGGCDQMLLEALDVNTSQDGPSTNRGNLPSGNSSSVHASHGDSGYSSEGSNSSLNPRLETNLISKVTPFSTHNTTSGMHTAAQRTVLRRGGSPSGLIPQRRELRLAGDNTVICNCGQNAALLTVSKGGPNNGRQFYKCGGPRGGSCNFFLWADQDRFQDGGQTDTAMMGPPRTVTASYNPPQPSTSTNHGDFPQCGCRQQSKLLTVQKAGPNKGRQFFVCPKPRGQGCSFFKWADESNEHQRGNMEFGQRNARPVVGDCGRGRGSGPGKKRGPGTSGGSSGKRRKCGLCGIENHTRRTCPNAGNC